MKPTVGSLRLRLNESADFQSASAQRRDDSPVNKIGPRVLASAIASHTVNVLVEGEMLDPATASDRLKEYVENLGHDRLTGECILRFLLPDEGKLSMAVRWLNNRTQLHVWDMAHRMNPPKAFYKAHPELVEACKLCGAAVLDAATPATLTTGSINPLAGEFLSQWIQSLLEEDPSETRPRFLFHVLAPPRHWQSIVRAHFGFRTPDLKEIG
jgi:hypothetical protein